MISLLSTYAQLVAFSMKKGTELYRGSESYLFYTTDALSEGKKSPIRQTSSFCIYKHDGIVKPDIVTGANWP